MSKDDQVFSKPSRRDEFLSELLDEIPDPIHKRLIEAYQGDDPVYSMETKLGEILLEVVHRED
jgi:hypothetical protein